MDFVTRDKEGRYEIIQACYEIESPETKKREERALHRAMEELGFPGRIIDAQTYLSEVCTSFAS